MWFGRVPGMLAEGGSTAAGNHQVPCCQLRNSRILPPRVVRCGSFAARPQQTFRHRPQRQYPSRQSTPRHTANAEPKPNSVTEPAPSSNTVHAEPQPAQQKPASSKEQPKPPISDDVPSTSSTVYGNTVKPFHLAVFGAILGGGIAFLSILLYITADTSIQTAILKVVRRLFKTVALRQVMGIVGAMIFVRLGLEPLVKSMRQAFGASGPWEKSTEYYVIREVYRPLEFLFVIAAVSTLAENFLPQLIAIPKGLVQNVARTILSLTFVIAAARVTMNIKTRMTKEMTWELELKGDITRQRRVEAVDKLLTLLTLLVASVLGLQAIGLDVNSVLAIGGVGGLAVGLAGREILENLFTGLIILSSNPFEVGDEILFRPSSGQIIEGIVLDVGWYRTTIRSFEREIYTIPNSVFSRNVVLNITRKQKEWRFYEFLAMRVEDMAKAAAVVSDMRKIIRQDPRIIQKLHRRVFLDKVTMEQLQIYVSFYVEAKNRDAFMAIKQDLLLAFADCVERNGARLARKRIQLEWVQPSFSSAVPSKSSSGKDADGNPSNSKAIPSTSTGAAVDVAAGPPNSSPPGGEKGPDGKPTHASGQQSAAGAAAAAAAVAKAVTISADDIMENFQEGSLVTGSWDDLPLESLAT